MKVNVKILILLAAMVLSVGTGVWAKDKGTPVKMTNWGVVYVPDDVYWQEGNQPMLTASSYDNDVVTMLEQIYPLEPATYQVVQKDGGIFRYGYVARYSANLWEIEAAVQRKEQENAYLRDIGSRPNMAKLLQQANDQMNDRLPQGFRMTKPITAKKIKGKTFYEGTWERTLVINDNAFTETIQGIAYQHGDYLEIALIFANIADPNDNLIQTMTNLFETVDKLPKK